MMLSHNRMLSLLAIAGTAMLGACSPSSEKEKDPGKLELSEIFYNAAGEDSLEFIEFRNSGEKSLDLAGVRLYVGDTVAFQFDASAPDLKGGDRIVVTNLVEQFKARFPGVTVYGPLAGKLNNSGESISAETSDSSELADCEYSSDPPWPVMASGGGYSLVYIGGDCKLASSWSSGTIMGGSPGKEDEAAPSLGVAINEVMPSDVGQTGWIELANQTGSSIDISGWMITDSLGKASSMTIPAGTQLPANGFLVLEEADYTGGLYPARTGETLYLVAIKSGAPTGSAIGLKYPALALGKTAGVVELDDGTVQMSPLASATKGAVNSGMAHGALVFSEIMYHPLEGAYEYVEIINTTADSVLLADPFDPERVWKVEGIGFSFPSGAKVPGNGKIVLVSEDVAAETFRSQQAIPAEVLVYEFTGKLANSTETLTIKEPLVAVAGDMGTTDYANTWSDQVTYQDGGSWPASADGEGKALIRTKLDGPGSDPSSWTAGEPSPGK